MKWAARSDQGSSERMYAARRAEDGAAMRESLGAEDGNPLEMAGLGLSCAGGGRD